MPWECRARLPNPSSPPIAHALPAAAGVWFYKITIGLLKAIGLVKGAGKES